MEELDELLASRNLVFAPSSGIPFAQEPIVCYDSEFQQDMRVPLQTVNMDLLPLSDEDSEADGDDNEERPRRAVVSMTGTRQQAIAAHTIISMLDEHIEVDAYAGTGKTHLIMALAAQAPGAFTYVTPRAAHMHGGKQAAGSFADHLRKRTLSDIAWEVARPLLAARGIYYIKVGDGDASPDERAKIAGIERIGPHSPGKVVSLAERAIRSWAQSDSPNIQPWHFKHALGHLANKAEYVVAAEALWRAMWEPRRKAGSFTLRLSDLVKWLNLQGATIPNGLGTLLVDEAHDLMTSWRQLLDRYPGGCIFLGDPYQRLQGRISRHGRNKMLAMTQSFRIGLSGENAIQRTLETAPEQRFFDPFVGSRGHITHVRHWSGRSETLQDGLRVYANEWALLEDAQRLKVNGGRFLILPATVRDLRKLVSGAVTLYNQKERGWQALAGGYRTWDELAAALTRDGRKNVIRLFDKGYNLTLLEEMLAAQQPEGQQKITLGMVPHVKNLESSTVALNDCCFTDAQTRHGHVPAHAVYLALSRVRDELFLPGDAFDRLSTLKAPPAEPWELSAGT